MYIYTKIEIQTNTHIPLTPSPPPPHRKHSSSPEYTKHIYTHEKKRSGDTISTTYYRK